jgi:hypothetical protein
MEGRRMCVGVRGCGRGEAQSHDHFLLSSSLSFSLSPYLPISLSLSVFLSQSVLCSVYILESKEEREGREVSREVEIYLI